MADYERLLQDKELMRPSPAQLRAQQLRDAADRIEDLQFQAIIRQAEQESLRRLRITEQVIIARLKNE